METNSFTMFLRFAAIAGNILFVLWITFNAMDDGFSGTTAERISGAAMISLLALNCFLLLRKSKEEEQYS